MVVRTQSNGREVTGLYVGTRNARRHFRKHLRSVELHLGELCICCELGTEFWTRCPEICDARLGEWLASRVLHGRSGRAPVPLVLVPLDRGVYKLHPFRLPHISVHNLDKIGASSAALPRF